LLAEEKVISKDIKHEMIEYDFSNLWTHTENNNVFGFIGDNYQRLQIKFISVVRDKENPSRYFVYGKDMVKNRIFSFQGVLEVENAFYRESQCVIEKKTGYITGKYRLFEEQYLQNTGIFKGRFLSYWYFDEQGKLHYDDLCLMNDGYKNNQFEGTWVSYDNKQAKVCNWGDYRIPGTFSVDMGCWCFQ